MADVVDHIISDLMVRGIDQYQAAYRVATKDVDDHIAALKRLAAASKLADRMMTDRSARGTPGSDAAKEANAAVAAVKRAAKDKADAEKAAAKEAAEAVKAAERAKAAATKATARERAAAEREATKAAEQRAVAERAASDAVIAAAEKEAAARVRLAEVAQRAVDRRAAGIARADPATSPIGRTVPREPTAQRSIPSAVLIGSNAFDAEVEREINHLLADDLSLRARLTGATGAEAAALRDQRQELALIAGYKRAGLTDEEAALRIEGDLAVIERNRAVATAERVAAAEKAAAAEAVAAAEQRAAAEAKLTAQSNKTAGALTLLAPTLIGGIGAHEISELNDEYIKLTNSLKIAGVGASNFDEVQKHLLTTANRTGTDINALADLYRSAALASHDLGASQQDLLRISDAVANALRIQGRSSTEARGAILQLGHAFESGRVTAREFNSLALNLYPILQSVAKGSDQFGGSVAKLRQALLAGDLSSKVFFQDLLKGSDDLADRAGRASLTTAQGFTALRNSLVVYFGQADKAQGVSAALGAALGALANNLDTVIPAIAAIGTALAAGYIVRAGAAAAATQNLGGVVSAAFGGGIGVAITGVTIALASFAVEANTTAAGAAAAHERLVDLQEQLHLTSANAKLAAGGVAGVGQDALGAIPHVNAFAGAVGNLAQQLYNQARAARAARVESLRQQLAEGERREKAFGEQTAAGRRVAAGDAARGLLSGDLLGYAGNYFSRVKDAGTNLLSGGKRDRDAERQYQDTARGNILLRRQLTQVENAPITPADIPGGAPSRTLSAQAQKQLTTLKTDVAGLEQLAGGATGARLDRIKKAIDVRNRKIADIEAGVSVGAASAAEGGGRGRRGPSAETLARRAEAARAREVRGERQFDRELRMAQSGEAAQAADLADDPAVRAEIERQRARDAAEQMAKEIASRGPKKAGGTGEYSSEEVQQLLGINQRTADFRVAIIDQGERRRTADEARSIDRAEIENRRQALQAQQALATTTAERRALARQLLDLDYKQREADLRAVLATDSKASDAEKRIARDRLALLPGQKALERQGVDRQNEGRGAAYLRNISPDRHEFIQDEEVKALDLFNRGLDETVAKTLHLHGIFGEILTDLVDMAIKQALIKPIGKALFGGEDGGRGSGDGGLFGKLVGAVVGGASGARASGGPVIAGNTYLVGERGPELFRAPSSGTIVPNHALIAPNNANVSPPVNVTHVHQTVNVDASNSVNPDGFERRILDTADQRARSYAALAGRQAVGAAPAAVRQEQVLKG